MRFCESRLTQSSKP